MAVLAPVLGHLRATFATVLEPVSELGAVYWRLRVDRVPDYEGL